MLPRTLEPEVMDTAEEASEYDAMDHRQVNDVFVSDFLAAIGRTSLAVRRTDQVRPLMVLDCGTGTAQIPILLARESTATITAIDLSQEMLRLAAENVRHAGLASRILLRQADGKRLPFDDDTFDAVMSNSIVHHIPDPRPALAEMVRVLKPGGLWFIRDLLRPPSASEVGRLVSIHAQEASERQRALLRDSLHAALTLDEVASLLEKIGLPSAISSVSQTSDRHWTIAGVPVVKGRAIQP